MTVGRPALIWYKGDEDAEHLVEFISAHGVEPALLRLGDSPDAYSIAYTGAACEIHWGEGTGLSLSAPATRYIYRNYSVIPQAPVDFAQQIGEWSAFDDFASREWTDAFSGVLGVLEAVTGPDVWMNAPSHLHTENKILHLHAARSIGLTIPETWILTKANTPPDWLRDRPAVLKPINTNPFLLDGSTLPTTLLTSEATRELLSGPPPSVPTFLQEHIPRTLEYRTFVVDANSVSVEMTTKSDLPDIRWSEPADLALSILDGGELRERLGRQSQQWCRKLGYRYAAVDHLLDSSTGELKAVDINPNGSWNWYAQLLPSLRTVLHELFLEYLNCR